MVVELVADADSGAPLANQTWQANDFVIIVPGSFCLLKRRNPNAAKPTITKALVAGAGTCVRVAKRTSSTSSTSQTLVRRN